MPAARSRRLVALLVLAVLVTSLVPTGIDANGRGGVRLQGEILGLRCGASRTVAACRVSGRRVLVDLTGASIFANGEPVACDALAPGSRFAAYGHVISRDPLALDACLFIQRAAEDEVAGICGDIRSIDAAEGLVVLSTRGRGLTEVRIDPGLTRISLEGERATLDDLSIGQTACAVGLLRPGEPNPVMRPTLQLNARGGR